MAIALTLQQYLENNGVKYDVLPHTYTRSSMNTAESARVPGDQLAKSIILEDDQGYLMAVVPATHHIEIGRLSQQLHRKLGLATERELGQLFSDCDLGAIPPIGEAYGMDVILEDSLSDCADVFFEAGDHTEVIHVRGEDFKRLMGKARHGHFSRHL
jgi:Ala-tRNA(Pro) deacylase